MANAKPLKNKEGKIYGYQLRVFRGRDVNGKQLKPYSMVWHIPEGMVHPKSIKKELEKAKAQFENDCKAGLVSSDKKTFQVYAEYVMTLKDRDLKHRTVFRYRQLLNRINDEIGFLKLTDVTSEHLNRFYIKLGQDGANQHTKGPLSTKTILEYHHLIHTIYAQAVKEGVVRSNPADAATPPAHKRKEAEFFELEEIDRIKECLEKEPLKWQVISHLLIASGARRGEIMGLKWEHIDFKKNAIRVSNNLQYTADRGTYDETTKTDTPHWVSIAPEVMRLLSKYRKEQAVLQLQMGDRWEDSGYCFTQANGKPMNPNSITDWLWKFSKKYNLPHIHPHKFRHTQASILISEGVDPVTVSKRLGHSQVSTTQNIYAHLVSKAEEEANEVIASVLYKKKA